MKCPEVRELVFRRIDEDLPVHESEEFDAHLAACESCAREYRLLSLPSRMAKEIPSLEPSPYFYQRLKANLEGEAQNVAGWQSLVGLARQIIPALAGVTLALLLVFTYIRVKGNEPDLYKAYDRVFTAEDQTRQMFSDEGEISDEAVLRAIAEPDSNYHRSRDMK